MTPRDINDKKPVERLTKKTTLPDTNKQIKTAIDNGKKLEQKFDLANAVSQMQKITDPERRRESSAGIHFIEIFGLCPWKGYLKYVLGIEPVYTDMALIAGSSFHEAKATWYNTKGNFEEAMRIGRNEIESRKKEFYGPEDYDYAMRRLKPMFKNWVQTYGESDLTKYRVLGTELEFRIPIPFTPGFVTTQRHDALLQDIKTGKVITGETKTSSTSLDFTFNSVRVSSQVAAYYWGGYEVFGSNYDGVMIDVTYWSARSYRATTIQSKRSEILTRTDYQIKQMQVELAALFNEVDAKIRALKAGVAPEFLFRRSPYYCYSFFKRCPYIDICKYCPAVALKRLGDNLKISDKKRTLDSLTYDPFFRGEGPL